MDIIADVRVCQVLFCAPTTDPVLALRQCKLLPFTVLSSNFQSHKIFGRIL